MRVSSRWRSILLLAASTRAIEVDINNVQSISDASKTIVENIFSIYDGKGSSGIPGLFPENEYYWYESGMAFDSLVNYWSLTGDDTYNDRVSEALLFQVGPDYNYMPPNQSTSLGNDDQSTWALAAMTAAERGFPDPPSGSGVASWVQLAQNVFDTQVARWDTKTCDGGLRWQVFSFNAGYDYKNSLSNGNFMQLAARLAKFTGNQTYNDWAQKASKWSLDIGLVDDKSFSVYDGTNVQQKCSNTNQIQWTATMGTYLAAHALLSKSATASQYAPKLLDRAIEVFATTPNADKDNVLLEVACAPSGNCNTDQQAFRAILARALAVSKDLDQTKVDTVLKASAQGAAAACSGGSNGTACGSDWSSGRYDGSTGLGQDLSALEIMLANIPSKATQTANSTSSSSSGGPSGTASGSGAAAASQTGTGDASSLMRSTLGLVCAVGFVVILTL